MMILSVYMNNAATGWPKPPCVPRAVFDFMTLGGASLTRGSSSRRDVDTLDMVTSCRAAAADLLGGYNGGDPRYVTLTSGVTESLNAVLKGYLKKGMTVATTSMEHNAVVRPLWSLRSCGISVKVLACDGCGKLDPEKLRDLARFEKVDMFVASHGSNLCGTVQDVDNLAEVCRDEHIPFVLDTAQTAGAVPVLASDLGLSALCFTGHKGLMGPQGTGGIVWEPGFSKLCRPFAEGGTGSFSDSESQPDAMPDKFEAGTPNLPGIAGLLAALEWIGETGIDRINQREKELGQRLLDGLRSMAGARLYGLPSMEGRLPVFAVNFDGVDNAVLAERLADSGIETRPGLHCAPWAHKTLGSFPMGALRLSVGYFTTEWEIDYTLETLKNLLTSWRAS